MSEGSDAQLRVVPVDATNWRDVAALEVRPEQQRFVAAPAYYLALCAYGTTWHPLAVSLDDAVIGFLMWGVDPSDGACWLGGILIDRHHQGKGFGKAATAQAISMLRATHGHTRFALSYAPANDVARRTYAALGFVQTDEMADDEVVARLDVSTD